MKERFQADIGANIREFQQKLKQVDAQIRKTASGVDVQISANIRNFLAKVAAIDAKKKEIQRGDSEVTITAAIQGFMRGAALVRAQALALGKKRIVIPIRARFDNFRNVMGSIATFQRNFEEITGSMGRGGLMLLSPAMVPVIASTVGLIGQLGPMLGTILGSTFALATSFGAAGIGAAGFAAVAIPALKGVFDKASEITDLEMKIADAKAAGDIEKANEHLAEMNRIFKDMSGPQLEAHSALRDFQETFRKLVKDMEPGVLTAFSGGLTGLTGVFGLARPMIENVVTSVNNLMDSFNRSLETQDVKDFFSFLGDFAGPALETITQAAGNFVMGLFNMMEAFGPLATETQNSFLKMSESFRQWADGLSESEKFQTFVNYVSENMPKIRSIFSDAFQGIINTFAAFAPSSATMMTGLQDLMERFKNFSSTLSENQGFQNFVDYVKTNGPVVVSTIGSLITFIVNLGIALAPIGAKMLEMVNTFLQWSNSMLQAHPWLGKIAAGAFVLIAGLVAIAPVAILINSVFSGLILMMAKVVAKLAVTAVLWTAKWALMGAQALLHAARMAAAWFIALGPVGWITGIIIGLAILVIANWDKISAWTSKTWSAISSFVTGAVTVLMSLISSRFPALYSIISSYMTMAQSIISAVWSYIKGTFSNTLAFLKALVKGDFSGMRTAIQNQMELAKSTIQRIWDAVKGYLTTLLGVLLAKFGQKFAEIVSKIREKMGEAVKAVSEYVGKMPGEVLKFVGDMLSAGGDLVMGLIDGIKGMGTSAINAITGVVDGVVGKAKSLLKIKSPSRVFREMGQFVSEGLAIGVQRKSRMAVDNVARMANSMTSAFNPQLAMADMRASAQLDTSLNRADMGVVRKSFAAEIDSGEQEEPAIYVTNELVGDKILTHVNRGQAKQSRLTDGFYGK